MNNGHIIRWIEHVQGVLDVVNSIGTEPALCKYVRRRLQQNMLLWASLLADSGCFHLYAYRFLR